MQFVNKPVLCSFFLVLQDSKIWVSKKKPKQKISYIIYKP